MSGAPLLPQWAGFLVGLLLLSGAAVTLVGAIGLLRFRSFYERVHAPTLGSTIGMALILLASLLSVSTGQGRPVVHELLVALFVTLTTPIALVLLARAALHRDRAEGSLRVPPERDEDGQPQSRPESRPLSRE